MNAFSFGQHVKQAVEPMRSGVVSPNLGMDKAKFIPPPKQNVKLPTSGKYNYQTRGGLVTNINGQAVPMNDEQKSYLAKIDDVRRRMDSSNLLGDEPAQDPFQEVPSTPQRPTPNAQDTLSKMRVQQVYADRAAAMKRQGLNANNPADLAKFKGGRTGPMAPSTATPIQKARPTQSAQATAPTPPARPRPAPMSMLSSTPMQPKVTTTPVDNAALRKQLQQAQQQPPVSPAPPPPAQPAPMPQQQPAAPAGGQSMFQKMKGYMPGTSAWTGQTGSSPGPLSSPMSSVSTSFNNATGQQDPPHIITTDNGRKFNTQTKTFLDGRPGGFAQ